MRNIRSLSAGRLATAKLVPELFVEYGPELEDLKITHSGVDSIKSHAFKNIRSVRRLDLSENNINSIENDAFDEVGHSLIFLKISHGLSAAMNTFPVAIRALTSLQHLDLSNNRLSAMSDTSLHFSTSLRTLELNDNAIEQIAKGTFQGDLHSHLATIALSFNSLRRIEQHTFVELKVLRRRNSECELMS